MILVRKSDCQVLLLSRPSLLRFGNAECCKKRIHYNSCWEFLPQLLSRCVTLKPSSLQPQLSPLHNRGPLRCASVSMMGLWYQFWTTHFNLSFNNQGTMQKESRNECGVGKTRGLVSAMEYSDLKHQLRLDKEKQVFNKISNICKALEIMQIIESSAGHLINIPRKVWFQKLMPLCKWVIDSLQARLSNLWR